MYFLSSSWVETHLFLCPLEVGKAFDLPEPQLYLINSGVSTQLCIIALLTAGQSIKVSVKRIESSSTLAVKRRRNLMV